jgi:hypothetical protein
VDLKEAIRRIKQLETRVLRRKRGLALQDAMALSLLISGLLSTAIIIYIRLRPVELRWWIGVAVTLLTVTAILVIRWLMTRATAEEAAFVIDDRLDLEDRITTARAILERGGPDKAVEIALIEDVASRIEPARASTITPYGFPRWYALSMAALIAVGMALMVPQSTIPGAQELAAERAEIQSAGEQLEERSSQVERLAPAGSETANLAREQADLGRSLRRSLDSRAEVLRKLSTLQDRIRVRHDQLAETRADEVVTTAEQRLRSAVAEKPRQTTDRHQPGSAEAIETVDGETQALQQKRAAAPGTDSGRSEPARDRGLDRAAKSTEVAANAKGIEKSGSEDREVDPRDPLRETDARSKGGAQTRNEQSPTAEKAQGSQAKTEGQRPDSGSRSEAPESPPGQSDETANAQSGKPDAQQGSQEKPLEIPSGLAGAAAEQAAKVLPSLSQQLLKKAAQLRANELKPEDIKRLQQAAQLLARDLDKIAQSKELQQAVEELARQVKPEQLEQVARELANNEQLKREMEAAAKLMMENQQTKQAVAGLAQELAQQRDQFRAQRGRSADQPQLDPDLSAGLKSRGAGSGTTPSPSSRGGRYERGRAVADRLNAPGREAKVSGRLQRGAGGEYLYLQAKPGAGASRTAYSSAYPQYRREAERSVGRSQVPLRMRSVVRDYFDAINPDLEKKP